MDLTPPPHMRAMFDQQWASVSEKLDLLLETYEHVVKDHEEDVPREWAIVFLSACIESITSHPSCAEILACAMDRLMRSRV